MLLRQIKFIINRKLGLTALHLNLNELHTRRYALF